MKILVLLFVLLVSLDGFQFIIHSEKSIQELPTQLDAKPSNSYLHSISTWDIIYDHS
ncbi:MAG: hypothetical protein MRY83_18315 [Flavobacteriales bacterium]|nr:hypothetical protein [Flavobacteriales bacterium]